MDSYRRVAALKIESAQDRACAIVEEIDRAENKVYASPGSKHLLRFVKDAALSLQTLLDEERLVVSSDLLTSSELETRLHRTTKLIPVLHMLLGFVEGSDVHRSPGQLIQPLRRYVRSIMPNSEIVVSAKAELNYSIQDIAGPLKELFSQTSLQSSTQWLPELLFLVNIPAVESGQILIHGLLAHELGHPLYAKRDLADKLRGIKVKEELIRNLVRIKSDPHPGAELRVRELVTQQVANRIAGWVMELSSDAIGIRLFGPAVFFAATHLMTSFKHLDQGSNTHPPPRLRAKLMIRMLKQSYSVEHWHERLQGFMRDWDDISAKPIVTQNLYDQLAIETVDDKALDLIAETSALALSTQQFYAAERYDQDVADLAPLLVNLIPPGEIGPIASAVSVELVSIINAGWYVYLCEFEAFRGHLHPHDSATRFASTVKLHELILKALEISEMKKAWEEARLDSKRRKN